MFSIADEDPDHTFSQSGKFRLPNDTLDGIAVESLVGSYVKTNSKCLHGREGV